MALIKNSEEFLNRENNISFFHILLSFHDVPFFTGQTTHMLHLFFILAAAD